VKSTYTNSQDDSNALSLVDKSITSRRESALVNILGRIADQLEKHDAALENISAHQLTLTKAIEAADFNWKARQIESDAEIGKLRESISRYRSDMLSLVNEQDHINKSMVCMNNLINKTTYSLEQANQALTGLEGRIKVQEKAVNEHFTHSIKQSEILPKVISDSTRGITKLHMDTEKHLGKMHQETQRQLEKLQQETTRRLLVLGDVESALQTLLIRTEPPEKKPFWFVRLFRKVSIFFRTKLSHITRKQRPQ